MMDHAVLIYSRMKMYDIYRSLYFFFIYRKNKIIYELWLRKYI